MKKLTYGLMAIAAITASICHATEWVPLGKNLHTTYASNTVSRVSKIDVAEATAEQVRFGATLPGFYRQAVTMQDGTDYSAVVLPGAGKMPVGHPDLPAFGQWVLVPNGAEIEISVDPGEPVVIQDYAIPPVQPAPADSSDESPPFTKDEAIYEGAADYPAVFARTDGIRTIRGQSSALVWLFPYRWNPATKELKVYPDLEATVSFVGEGKSAEQRLRSPVFDNQFRRMAPNADAVLALPTETRAATGGKTKEIGMDGENYGGTSNGCDVLIICPGVHLAAGRTLADWKCKRGFIAEVCSTTVTGSTAEEIRDFILNAYSTWSPAPSYVLLIGDADQVPVHYGVWHSYHSSATANDLYYADMDTPYDLIADLAVGRWPVDTAEQSMNCALRAIEYESSPPDPATYPHFYTNATQCGAFQDGASEDPPDGYADRRFAKTSEDIRNFLRNEGYNSERIYTTYNGYDSSTIYPSNWTQRSIFIFENDTLGAPLPAELLKPAFPWDGGATEIQSAVNQGTFMVTHRDHGSRGGWGEPALNEADVDSLTNGSLRPVVFTINCQTAWFDNETDAAGDNTDGANECFSEHWMQHATGGAIGLIGATRVSYSGYNDRLVWGWMDAIWPDFIEYHSGSYGSGTPIYCMGDVLNYGRVYLMTKYSSGTTLNIALEEYVWLGDPTLEIWTGIPGNFAASHNATLPPGTTTININVNENGTLVNCVFDGRIVGSATVAGGIANVTLNPAPSHPGTLHITATKHNFLPYKGTCIFNDPDFPTVTTDSTVSDITSSSAAAGGTVVSAGASTVTERGICWSSSPYPTTADNSIASGSGTGHFTAALTGLDSEQSCFARAYAVNSHGTAYGDPIDFATLFLAPYSESFEAGLGRWVNASDDDGDWSLNTDSTPSSSTGPDGAQDGSCYLFTEASSGQNPGTPNKTAHLDLEVDVSGLALPALSFYYHMYGAAMGSLHVDVYDGSWHLDVWSVSGQQHASGSDAWTQKSIDLTPYAGNVFTLRFRGTTGSSFTSDMAIDNICVVDNTPHLDHFTWAAIPDPQAADVPFAVEISAKDQFGNLFNSFTGTVAISGEGVSESYADIVITECDPGSPDFIEIQNASGQTLDASGLLVVVSDSYSDVNSVNSTYWTLPSSMAADEVAYMTDNSGDNYWGANIFWNPENNGWAMVVDDNDGSVVDFVAWGWDASDIGAMAPEVNGHTISIGDQFTGNGVSASGNDSIQRQGDGDHDTAGDFAWVSPESMGTQNAGLSIPLTRIGIASVLITPSVTDGFTAGVWSGTLIVSDVATNVVLLADDGSGHTGSSGTFDALSATGDSDGDCIADWWEIMYFENTASCVATNHNDDDPHNNQQEYIAGTNPTNGNSCFMVTNFAKQAGAGGYLVEWVSVEGRLYSVLRSPDLLHGSFTPVESGIEYPQHSCTDTLHAAEAGGFYRVDVELK
jgi:hypothetical protein